MSENEGVVDDGLFGLENIVLGFLGCNFCQEQKTAKGVQVGVGYCF